MPFEEYSGSASAEILRRRLRNVYWIGGGSCAGKSTIARRLAERWDLVLYSTDDVMAEHSRRSTAGDCPLLHQFLATSLDERWVLRSPDVMLATFHWFQGEGFPLIVEDLLRIPAERRVLVEGFRVLPQLVRPILFDSRHAVWLLPSPEFRRATMERRGGASAGFLAQASDPKRALENLLARDEMFTERLAGEVARLGLSAISMGMGFPEEAAVEMVVRQFGF
ncbi:hypothetical protein [Paludibaculum fermentans]|uniref:hypothetical protein n=1 Tax=Paludibaculum fermentans TaxID=1473598 RepID=UPI003EB9702F